LVLTVAGLVLALDSLAVKDHGATRATERLVCGRGDNVAVLKGVLEQTSREHAGNVRNVRVEVGADAVSDLAELGVVVLGGGKKID